MKRWQKSRIDHNVGMLSIGVLLTALAGCYPQQGVERPESRNLVEAPISFSGNGAMLPTRAVSNGQFAYTHELLIEVGARFVAAHFERAKTLCLQESALRCVLLEANASSDASGLSRPNAHLQLRLPHESVDRFSKLALSPVEEESANDVVLVRSTTRLDDVARPIADTKRQFEQLENYRQRLENLESRGDTRVEDLIRIANELAQTQSRIEEIDGQRRRFEERIETELLDLSIRSESAAGGALAPVERVWRSATIILGSSAAQALAFVLALIPWTPIVVLALVLLRWIWRSWSKERG